MPVCLAEATKSRRSSLISTFEVGKAKGGFEFVFVVTNHFTRYVQAFATKTKSAKAAAEKLYSYYILTYGLPS